MLAVALALACMMGIANTGMNSDLFLAIAAGRQTWEGYPVGPDRWSFTVPGAIWTDQAWLSHLVLYLSYEALGNLGPVACKILLLLGCVAIVLVRCRRMGAFPGVSLLATYLGVMSSAPFLTIRAENFGVFYFLLFGLLLWEGDRDRALRAVAIPAVMALWSNCHGSFMFGLGLLGFRVFLECCAGVWNRVSAIWSVPSGQAQYPNPDRGQWRVCIEWSLVFLGSLLLVSTLTPFGPGNVLMPFIQVGSGLVTANSADWLPLWAPGQIRGPLGAGSVFPYLISLGVLIGSCMWLVGSWLVGKDTRDTETQRREEGSPQRHGDTEKRRGLTSETQRHGEEKRAHLSDCVRNGSEADRIREPAVPSPSTPGYGWRPLVVEVAVLTAIVILSCKFRRLILFAGLSCVPLTALVLSLCAENVLKYGHGRAIRIVGGITVGTLLLCVSTGWACYRFGVVPYLPDNPLRPPRPLARDLMSYDTFSAHLITFLGENAIHGNAVVGWELSTYVLCHARGIRVFMDTRDQSLYPPEVIRDYFAVMGVREESAPRRLALLDRYRVDLAILSTDPYEFALAMVLLESRRWGCIYQDDYSMVLVRNGSARFGEMVKTANLSGLKFPDKETRNRTEAIQSWYGLGKVKPDLVQRLKQMVLTRPSPNYYVLICRGMDDPARCFQASTTDFLLGEAARLSKISPLYRHGAREITESLVKIFGILAENSIRCGNRPASLQFGARRDSFEQAYQNLSWYYLGQRF